MVKGSVHIVLETPDGVLGIDVHLAQARPLKTRCCSPTNPPVDTYHRHPSLQSFSINTRWSTLPPTPQIYLIRDLLSESRVTTPSLPPSPRPTATAAKVSDPGCNTLQYFFPKILRSTIECADEIFFFFGIFPRPTAANAHLVIGVVDREAEKYDTYLAFRNGQRDMNCRHLGSRLRLYEWWA